MTIEPGRHMADIATEDCLINSCFIWHSDELGNHFVSLFRGGIFIQHQFCSGDGYSLQIIVQQAIFNVFIGGIKVENIIV